MHKFQFCDALRAQKFNIFLRKLKLSLLLTPPPIRKIDRRPCLTAKPNHILWKPIDTYISSIAKNQNCLKLYCNKIAKGDHN